MRDELLVGSLFSGIGGIELGLERTGGFRTAWLSELDPHAGAVLARHWPDVPNLGDVRGIGADVPRVHVLAGGFPCQPVSDAGRRKAQADERWLWPEFERLVGELRPRIVLVENVPGLAGRGLSLVVGGLAALGYDAEWTTVSAASVGAPHLRERLFVVAYPGGGREAEAPTDSGRVAGPTAREREERPGAPGEQEAQGGAPGRPLAGAPGRAGLRGQYSPAESGIDGSGYLAPTSAKPGGGVSWGVYEPAIRRWELVRGTAPTPMDEDGWLEPGFVEWLMGFPPGWTAGASLPQRLKMLGNAVQVQVAERVGAALLEAVEEGRL